MNREIKFRAWHKDLKKMFKIGQITFEKGTWNFEPTDRDFIGMSIPFQPSFVLMQYTGLHDKNGKEIYEGDIIEFSYDVFTENFDTKVGRGTIEFIDGAFYIKPFEIEGKKIKDIDNEEWFLLYTVNTDTLKVIGNVFENGDILNDSKNTEKN